MSQHLVSRENWRLSLNSFEWRASGCRCSLNNIGCNKTECVLQVYTPLTPLSVGPVCWSHPHPQHTSTHTGFVSARLRGEYGITRDDKIDLEFSNITLNIGPWKAAEKVGWLVCCSVCVVLRAFPCVSVFGAGCFAKSQPLD